MSVGAGRLLELRDLTVVRGGRRVLEGLSLSITAGEVVVVVGPNGAGKSTLLEAIIGAVPLVAGQVSLAGQPVRTLSGRARSFSFLAGEAEPPAEVSVSTLLGHDESDWVRSVERRLALAPLRGATAGALSRGERRRLLLFEALTSGKPFLLLDEPTGVFDPRQLLDVVAVFREAARRGAGLLVTVHQMSDAEALADRLLILNRGDTMALGTMAELRDRAGLGQSAPLQEVFLALLSSSQAEGVDAS